MSAIIELRAHDYKICITIIYILNKLYIFISPLQVKKHSQLVNQHSERTTFANCKLCDKSSYAWRKLMCTVVLISYSATWHMGLMA